MKIKLKSIFKLPTKPCTYCGQEVRFPYQYHKECKKIHEAGQNEVLSLTIDCVANQNNMDSLALKVDEVSIKSFISSGEKLSLVANGLDSAVDIILKGKEITTYEENYIHAFISYFTGIEEIITNYRTLAKVDQVKFLNQISRGEISNIDLGSDSPFGFNLMKSEKLIYIFPEEVAYYRVMQSGLQYESNGKLAITTKHIYYISERESFRIRFDSILNMLPNHGGIEIHKHSASDKPKIFENLDGVFFTELIHIVSNIDNNKEEAVN